MAISLAQAPVSAGGTGASPLALTFGSTTTAGNCVFVLFVQSASGASGTISGITLGGAAGNFASIGSDTNDSSGAGYVSIWADPNCTASTAVSVAFSGTSGNITTVAFAYEFSGLASTIGTLTDKSSFGQGGPVGAWSSLTTATTANANELWLGVVGCACNGAYTTITGPSSPWTNATLFDGGIASGYYFDGIAGYDIVSSTGTATYNGTNGTNGYYAAGVGTFKAGAGVTAGTASLSGTGTVTPKVTERVTVSAAGTGTVTPLVVQRAISTLSGLGDHVNQVYALIPANEVDFGTGTVIANAIYGATSTLSGTGTVNAVGTFSSSGTSTLPGTGAVNAQVIELITTKLTGTGNIAASAQSQIAAVATPSGTGTVAANLTQNATAHFLV